MVAYRPYLGAPHTGSDAMKKPRKDPVRENRIHEEVIVDAYGSEEKAMSWYYYLEGKLSFPVPRQMYGVEDHLATQEG